MSNKYKPYDMVGNWLLLKEVDKPSNRKAKGVYWDAECQCENKTRKVVFEGTISAGKSKSCGCSRTQNIKDKKIGKLTPEYMFKRNGRTYWHCKCDCGNEKDVSVDKLTGKEKTLSCGCLRMERIKEVCGKTNSYRIEGDLVFGLMSCGKEFYIDKEDLPLIQNKCWYLNNQGYVVSDKLRLNRVIAKCNDSSLCVDHQNGNTLDNRKCNLRQTAQLNNTQNTRISSNNTSGMKGVWFDKRGKKWCAEIIANKHKIFIGRFKNKFDAIIQRFNYECILFDKYSRYYNQETDSFVCIACGYKLEMSRKSILPIADTIIEEVPLDILKSFKSERGDGALGSSGK